MNLADFIEPQDPVRPRSTGYSAGHTRSLLGLDSFGPRMAERNRLAREVGMLPDSPNVDRERVLANRSPSPDHDPNVNTDSRASSPGNSTVSTCPGSADPADSPIRRPKTMSQLDDPKMFLPPMMNTMNMNNSSNRSNNYGSNNQVSTYVHNNSSQSQVHTGGSISISLSFLSMSVLP